MPSKSKRRNRKKEWRVKQPERNWLELPSDLTVNILQRVGVIDRIENAQLVCTTWRKIYKDPAMWRVVYLDRYTGGYGRLQCRDMSKVAVHRSQGQLVDLTLVGFCDNHLLEFVADRSSHLRRLETVLYVHDFCEIWSEVFKKFPLLEELSLVETKIWKKDIEAAGRYCPLLKTLKLNERAVKLRDGFDAQDSRVVSMQNEIALAIGKNLPELTHLELIGNPMTNIGLEVILDGCCHLEVLDLRWCLYIDLTGDLGKRCLQQIKCLKLPHDSLEGLSARDMDSKEQSEKLKNHEARFAAYLKANYFSDKDIYGGELFEEKPTIGGMTIRASSEAGTKSYADPFAYWNEKFAQKEPETETNTNLSNGKHPSEKSS